MSGKKSENLKTLLKYFPLSISNPLMELKNDTVNELCEIRIRAFCPIVLIFTNESSFITSSGRLTPFFNNDLIKPDAECVKEIFNQMCKFSVYSLTDNISNGFITLENGCRVGVYGTAVTKDDRIVSVRNVRGMNIRLAGSFNGVGNRIAELYENKRVNTLICGPPSSGKTTVLKDLCRTLSDKFSYKAVAIDERGEFDGDYLGYNTDILTGYPKSAGIQIAVRTLSPDIIVCDELGESGEVKCVIQGLNSGVNFVMTVHCISKEELLLKEQFLLLKESFALDYCVFLKDKSEVKEICTLKELENADCGVNYSGNNLCTCRTVHSL